MKTSKKKVLSDAVNLKALERMVRESDNEGAHCEYDKVMKKLARKQDPTLVAKVDKMVKGVSFWYA